MAEEILINVTPQETRVAVMANGVVQELHVERAASRGLVGNIYTGRVVRVLPGMQSAFIEIGLERAAFLHVADIWEERQNGEPAAPPRPIERILAEGQPLMVQVVKDPIGSKGARLSTQISIAGRLLVYLPQDSHIGISQRIEDEGGRKLLREKLQQLIRTDERGGYIIRTVAESASEADLANDLAYLRRLWGYIGERAQTSHAPALLHQDLCSPSACCATSSTGTDRRIVVDSRENFVRLQAFASDYVPKVLPKIEHYAGERPLFDFPTSRRRSRRRSPVASS